ncbi:MAG: S-adenosylmethionine:tRNA ribosyltransferase-isomerase, partial [Myxococcota bacterium]
MRVDDLDYKLPEALIAQEPLAERSAARMLVLNRGVLEHRRVRELPALLEPSLFVVNQTRVLAARLRGQKSTGGRAELLLVEPVDGQKLLWRTLGTANKPLKAGQVLHFDDVVARIEAREEGMLRVRFEGNFASRSFESFVAAAGEMPLPPYIARRATAADAERYQTIFASEPGAVAAPTAGLHFDDALVAALDDAGHRFTAVTLHVG